MYSAISGLLCILYIIIIIILLHHKIIQYIGSAYIEIQNVYCSVC